MKKLLRRAARTALEASGYSVEHRAAREAAALADLSAADRTIAERVAPYTLTGPERRASLLQAVEHLHRHRVPGDVVECGVWRGGSMMAVALALIARGDTSRHLWLYDTYEGMSEPTEADRSHTGESAAAQLARTAKGEGVWCEAGLADVRANLLSTGYPTERLHFVQGKVEDTIPGAGATAAPEGIALLRLDTDWYESTRHELVHLYPRLARHGVLIIDDYGHWQGARRAVDEYFAGAGPAHYLHRVDYTARLLVKP